jgi:hypothetical protein
MSLKTTIAKQVQSAVRILGTGADGLAPPHTYVKVAANGGTYDPVSRRVTEGVTEYTAIPVTMVRFSLDDMSDDVKPRTDRRALIAALDLPVVPGEQDRIVNAAGEVYTVHKILSDPADALYVLHVRMRERT